jgi:hypothetical protein
MVIAFACGYLVDRRSLWPTTFCTPLSIRGKQGYMPGQQRSTITRDKVRDATVHGSDSSRKSLARTAD